MYISSKMNYIYQYLDNICNYNFIPDDESKNNYKIIIHKMIQAILNIIFEGKLDQLFEQEIPKVELGSNSKVIDKKIDDILYLTQLPDIIQNILIEESREQEKKLYKKFEEEIKNINKIYLENSKIYDEFVKAIEEDTEEEKKRIIEYNYTKKKNEKETECKEREGKWSGYLDIIKNIDENELSTKDYNIEIKKLIIAQDYLNKKKNYFNKKEPLHTAIKIIFKKECKKAQIKYGEISEQIENIKINSFHYLNSKNVEKNQIKATFEINKGKQENLAIQKKDCIFYNIDKKYAQQEFEKLQNEIKSIKREIPKDIKVNLIINRNHKVDTKRIKSDENFKSLETIMGESGLKKQLNKGINLINKNEFSVDNIKPIIKELKNHFDTLKNLDFNTPKFENALGPSTKTINYCDKYKNEFKDRIIGKLESLIKFYDNFDKKKKKSKKNIESFDNSFSIIKFEQKRPKIKKLKIEKSSKFSINYPYTINVKVTPPLRAFFFEIFERGLKLTQI